jgi:serine/threonine-protein kinase RsbW
VIAHSEIPDKSHSFGWFVLEALVDSVRLEQSEIDADGHITLTMTLEKGLLQERA